MQGTEMNRRPGSDHAEDPRRRHGRVRCQTVRSSVGDVVDASAGGMRVVLDRRLPLKEGMRLKLSIESFGEPFTVSTEVVWVKRKGMFRKEVGLRFCDVTPRLRRVLSEIAQSAVSNLNQDPCMPRKAS